MSLEVETTGGAAYGPWNPGIQSELPLDLVPLSTIFKAENVFTTLKQAEEIHDLSGLPLDDLVIFRPRRLAVHELLVRVTADLSVPDPEAARIDDLGINFRLMIHTILKKYIEPHMHEIVAAYDSLKLALSDLIDTELSTALSAAEQRVATERKSRKRGWFGFLRLFPERAEMPATREDRFEREEQVLRRWTEQENASDGPLRAAAYRSLTRVISAVRAKHGRVWGDKSLLAPLAIGLACNDYGSTTIGRLIEPYIHEAAEGEGYHMLPVQERPIVMNTKGASASGKSTMRPLQKRLAAELGVHWSDFAIISPDIWRKYLLDYTLLGDSFKYAAALTGRELAIIDHKLDRYMAQKAAGRGISHLLIDRFRFDSFAPHSDEAGSNLLTRFGGLIYMFFMVTPPHETVTRAWKRGLEVGRYKAVDDLLAHNVEAYTGMPILFFTWALRTDKVVHYEFLDNSVLPGEQPRTMAFGKNNEMNILDVKGMLDIERYRKIDVNADAPEKVYRDHETMAAANNTQFLSQCVHSIPIVCFAERDTGRIYARFESGRLVWTDRKMLEWALEDEETRTGILAIAADALNDSSDAGSIQVLQKNRFHTLGLWGERSS